MKKAMFAIGLLAACFASTANAGKPTTAGLNVMMREYTRVFVVGPGETAMVTSICAPGETVLSGAPTSYPPNLTMVISTLVYDGTNSGWTVEYRNDGTETVTTSAGTSALCTAGTITYVAS